MRSAKVESIDAHVGKRLRQRRIELGMSQQKLSGVTGVSYQQIQKYERGTNRIGASMLWLLSDVLNILPAYFFEGLSRKARGSGALLGLAEQEKAGYDADTLSDRETMELVKAYSAVLDPQVRKGVRQMLGALAKSGKPARPRKRRNSKS